MAFRVYWLQCGGCSGDSMSMLGSEAPGLIETLRLSGVELLWHPSLSADSPPQRRALLQSLLADETPLDALCVEGAVLRGPGGTGMYDTLEGRPKKDLVAALARKARHVVAVGTCASFGGIVAAGDVEATGLQFLRDRQGGLLGTGFRSASGAPVLNLPGCPVHAEVVVGALAALASSLELSLDRYQAPLQWYGMLVHQGCTRNEYHEYRVEESTFGERGCLFFHLGCQGPLTHGPCNKLLWAHRSSKTRAGVPCLGCTRPDFPRPYPFFQTRNIEGLPLDLPEGVKRAHYMVYKGMAAVAAPQRLQERKTEI
jgi:uptake hydrogenase small subunit